MKNARENLPPSEKFIKEIHGQARLQGGTSCNVLAREVGTKYFNRYSPKVMAV